MTDQQLNERLAGALGITNGVYGFHGPRVQDDDGFWTIRFSPATSVDDLRKWVLPEIKRRHRWTEFLDNLCDKWEGDAIERDGDMEFAGWLIEQDPAVLAAAALKALEEDQAEREADAVTGFEVAL